MSTHEQDTTTETPREGSLDELLRDVTILDAKSVPTYASAPAHITECEGCFELTPHVDNNGLCTICSSPTQVREYLRVTGRG